VLSPSRGVIILWEARKDTPQPSPEPDEETPF
jgi:hypothetical protein